MADYELTSLAEEDLKEIARYTLNKWGLEQTRRYESALTSCLHAIGQNKVTPRRLLKHRPELACVPCEHHYIFYQERKKRPPLILAVLHERMDLMVKLKARLSA